VNSLQRISALRRLGHQLLKGWTRNDDIDTGGWKSPRIPLQYAEKINAARSGMAKAAAATTPSHKIVL